MEEITEELNQIEVDYVLQYFQFVNKLAEEINYNQTSVSVLPIFKKVINFSEKSLEDLIEKQNLTNFILKGENFELDIISYIRANVFNKIVEIDYKLSEIIDKYNSKHN
jgi:hypothetical protein